MPRDDEYDDEPRDRRPPERGTNTTLWIVLAVIGGVFLLGALACGGLMYFGFRTAQTVIGDMTAATGAAETFLNQLQANQATAAYQSAGQTFKAAQTPEQFAQFVAKHPMLTGHTSRVANGFNMMQVNGVNKYRVQYTLSGANNSTTCTLMLVQENGTWVVESLTVP